MTIYQVIDDLNRPMYESADVDKANSEAELLNLIYIERYFFVAETNQAVH